jgi:hypothetical protein
MFAWKPDRPVGSDAARQHGGFQQPLQIDRGVVADLSQLAQRFAKAPAWLSMLDRPRVDTNAPIEAHDQIEQLHIPWIDHPVDAGSGKFVPQRRSDRNPMHDVAERAEAND